MKPFHLKHIVDKSLEWLDENHRNEVERITTEDFFALSEEMDEEAFNEILEEFGETIDFNYSEWLIADAMLEVDGKERRTAELLLGPEGPHYNFVQRAMIKAISESPLRFYEVVKTDPEQGYIHLKDLLTTDKKSATIEVYDNAASKSVSQKTKFIARIIEWNGQNILSGSIYTLIEEQAKTSLKLLKKQMKDTAKLDPNWQNYLISIIMVTDWLITLFESINRMNSPLPTLIDHSTGEPMVFTTDLYDVNKLEPLLEFLESHSSIDEVEKDEWQYLLPPDEDEMVRILGDLTLTNKRKRLKVEANTQKKCDELRIELEEHLGSAIQYRTRKIEDITSPRLQEEYASRPKESSGADELDLNSPELKEVFQQHIMKMYKNWADEPIPALDDKTPREMLKVRGGKKRVLDLLETYDSSAERQYREGRAPLLSYDFLYEELGLKRN